MRRRVGRVDQRPKCWRLGNWPNQWSRCPRLAFQDELLVVVQGHERLCGCPGVLDPSPMPQLAALCLVQATTSMPRKLSRLQHIAPGRKVQKGKLANRCLDICQVLSLTQGGGCSNELLSTPAVPNRSTWLSGETWSEDEAAARAQGRTIPARQQQTSAIMHWLTPCGGQRKQLKPEVATSHLMIHTD